MYLSRRRFIRSVGLSGAFAVARFRGLAQNPQSGKIAPPCFLHTGSGFAPFIDRFLEKVQPGSDAFVLEKYADEVTLVLKTWSDAFCSGARDLSPLQNSMRDEIHGSALAEPAIRSVDSGSPIKASKADFPSPAPASGAIFTKQLAHYLSQFSAIDVAELSLSEIEVAQEQPLRLKTTVHYDLVGRLYPENREERTGKWEITWEKDARDSWTVSRWAALGEMRSQLKGPGFQDVTAACLAGNASYAAQMQHGVEYWCTILDGASGIDIYGNNGISVGDFDGDGFDDLYVCQPAGLPNRLYRNRGDGTYEDVTERAGVGVLDGTSCAIFADLTNNGRQDLIVVRTGGPLLFMNRGNGVFELKPNAFHFAKPPQGTFTAAAVADYDRDGLLDVYFCLYSYYQGLSEYEFPHPYYDAQNGPPNFLFKNRGDGAFEDVTASSGMDQNNNRYSFACGWNDYNNDGWPDLYVVNDFGRKNLYRNKGDGTFEDVSAAIGVEDPGAGMSVCWFDYDQDGFDDLYVANMWSVAGKRITRQTQFIPTAPQEVLRVYRKHANGNSLFHNEGAHGTFRDVTDASGTRIGGWSWSSDAIDIDSDGYPDLYVVNGFISGPGRDNLSSFFWRQVVDRSLTAGGNSKDYEEAWNAINEFIRSDFSWSGYQRNNFYLNNRDGVFIEASGVLGLDWLDDSRSFALADIDHDGCLEIILKNRTSPQIRILQNQLTGLGSCIAFSLKGTKGNRDAIGAVIEVHTPERTQRLSLRAGSGFLAQHTKTLFFGLGPTQGSVRATVHWPNGGKQDYEGLPVGHRISITEGRATYDIAPFAARKEKPRTTEVAQPDRYPVVSETWLVEPILAPSFTLLDARGARHSLKDASPSPSLLLFFRADCEESQRQLRALQQSWPEWKKRRLGAFALRIADLNSPAPSPQPAGETESPFPILMADEATGAVYNIFHRYLFERRRDMVLPTCFLLNDQGEVIKVYSGFADPERILKDLLSATADTADTVRRALPFPGLFFGSGFHHNYFTYGIAFLQYGYLDQALESFKAAVRNNPSHAEAYYNIGTIYLNKSEIDEAEENLQKAVELDPADADAWNNLGKIFGEKQDYDRALRCFQRAVALRPTYVLALQNLVKLYVYLQRVDDATRILQKAIAIDPSEPDLHMGLATLLVNHNDLAGAKAEFEKVIELRPNDAEALNDLGVVFMQMSQPDQAFQCFQKCLNVAPDFATPYLNIALLMKNSGDRQKARELLSMYLDKHPDNAAVRQAIEDLDKSQ